MKEETAGIESALEALFGELLAGAAGRGFLSVKHESPGGGVTVTLTPSNPLAAKLVAHAENGNDTVFVHIGKNLLIEVLPSKGESLIAGVREVCEAAIAGRVKEEFWERGTEITKSIARIEYGGRVHVYRRFGGGLSPFSRGERRETQYQPYRDDQ